MADALVLGASTSCVGVQVPPPVSITNKGDGSDGGNTVETLILQYKELIDFGQSMEKNNFKFVSDYVKRQKKRNPKWETDCEEFLRDAIELQIRYNQFKNIERERWK